MTINSKAYFKASIGREDPFNLNSNIIKESFFNTGKGEIIDEYVETAHDGTTLFSDKKKMILETALRELNQGHRSIVCYLVEKINIKSNI